MDAERSWHCCIEAEPEHELIEYTGNPMTYEELAAAAIGEELCKAGVSADCAASDVPIPAEFLKVLARF